VVNARLLRPSTPKWRGPDVSSRVPPGPLRSHGEQGRDARSRCRRQAASKVEKIARRVRSGSMPSQTQQASNVTTPRLPASIQ